MITLYTYICMYIYTHTYKYYIYICKCYILRITNMRSLGTYNIYYCLFILLLLFVYSIIKKAEKGSGVVVWDREDYLKEAEKQLGDKEIYEELSLDPVSPLISSVKGCLSRVKNSGDTPDETLEYFFINKPKRGRFYLLPKIHKRLHNVPGRTVISNSRFFTQDISAF